MKRNAGKSRILKTAGMAELADALDLGSSEATRTGSIPATRTKTVRLRQYNILIEY